MSQTETLAIAPSTGVSTFSLGKGGDIVAVCHVPNGNDAHDAIYMEVGAKAADAHLANHPGDRLASGTDCTSDPRPDNSAAWSAFIDEAYASEPYIFSNNDSGFWQLSNSGADSAELVCGGVVTWTATQITLDIGLQGMQETFDRTSNGLLADLAEALAPYDFDGCNYFAGQGA